VIWEKQLNKHLLPPPQAELEALASPTSDMEERYGSTMETIYTFFLNYEQYIILLTICFFAGMAWRHHPLISRLFIIAASCLWVIYVYRYQIAVGWPALDASGELSLRELLSDGAFIRHWSSLLSAAALGGALGVAF
jgi:hypothetical protein